MHSSSLCKAYFDGLLFVILIQKINNFIATSDLQDLYIQSSIIIYKLIKSFECKAIFLWGENLSCKWIRWTEKYTAEVVSNSGQSWW